MTIVDGESHVFFGSTIWVPTSLGWASYLSGAQRRPTPGWQPEVPNPQRDG